jgi:hypothetical protein
MARQRLALAPGPLLPPLPQTTRRAASCAHVAAHDARRCHTTVRARTPSGRALRCATGAALPRRHHPFVAHADASHARREGGWVHVLNASSRPAALGARVALLASWPHERCARAPLSQQRNAGAAATSARFFAPAPCCCGAAAEARRRVGGPPRRAFPGGACGVDRAVQAAHRGAAKQRRSVAHHRFVAWGGSSAR